MHKWDSGMSHANREEYRLSMASFGSKSTAEQVTEGLDLSGHTYLVTGCNSGLGFETTRVLARRGARVLGAARNLQKAAAACDIIDGDAVPISCDLADPATVRSAVAAVQEPLHGIIANAGVMALPGLVVHHGVEAQMFINHVGHFALVTGLLDRLTTYGRVVVVASSAHSYARGKSITFEDLTWSGKYKAWPAYGRSKLANILFAKELARRLGDDQSANSLHPGIVDTGLWRNMPKRTAATMRASMRLRTIPQGAATQVFLATHPSVSATTGEYFGNCAIRQPSTLARDGNLATRLWETTERLVAGL